MKVPDSGMPDESYWNSLFDINQIVNWLELDAIKQPIIEIGCGYGTFTVPIAQHTKQTIFSYDIETDMLKACQNNMFKKNIINYSVVRRDVIENGTGLEDNASGLFLLFNILHFEERKVLIQEAYRNLAHNGIIAAIHWRKDIPTPRGPDMSVRPSPEDIVSIGKDNGFEQIGQTAMLGEYHWGIKMRKV